MGRWSEFSVERTAGVLPNLHTGNSTFVAPGPQILFGWPLRRLVAGERLHRTDEGQHAEHLQQFGTALMKGDVEQTAQYLGED